ncbi:PerC family transcriptional regulator [Entomohabitans teleogrylli]|uniref:PerC family transcriptional regulator n=1 Tax=Entomohabitans teleogrylli TaxID=1384589 RepID=UPI00073D6DE9|nr:PerC family transcriptional regulator [Entomohabitans teleogrylli]
MSLRDQIIQYLTEHPGSRVADIAEKMPKLNYRTIARNVLKLHADKFLTRKPGAGRPHYLYSVAEYPSVEVTEDPRKERHEKILVLEDIALDLEYRGLHRRAAAAWLRVFDLVETDRERERIAFRRLHCANRTVTPAVNYSGLAITSIRGINVD